MSDRLFSIILDNCLQRLDQGESLPDLLADFPEAADRLKPLLLVAMASRAFPVPVPSETAQRLGRNQMLAEMNRLEIKKAFRKKPAIPLTSRWVGVLSSAIRAGGFNHLAYSYRLAMVSLVLVLSGAFYTFSASASSHPGDLLYPLRMGLQRAGLVLSYDQGNPSDGESQPNPINPQFERPARSIWMTEGYSAGYQGQGETGSDPYEGSEALFSAADLLGEKELLKALKEAEKAADKELKEDEKDADKELKDAEKEADKELKDAEKEADKELKDAEKDDKKGDEIG